MTKTRRDTADGMDIRQLWQRAARAAEWGTAGDGKVTKVMQADGDAQRRWNSSTGVNGMLGVQSSDFTQARATGSWQG